MNFGTSQRTQLSLDDIAIDEKLEEDEAISRWWAFIDDIESSVRK